MDNKQNGGIYAANIKFGKELLQKYSIRTIEQDSNMKPVVEITSEFMENFRIAKQARQPYEDSWNETSSYLWGKGILKDKNKKSDTTQNLLWPIFVQKLAELTSNGSIAIEIAPNQMPKGFIENALKEVMSGVREMEGIDDETIEEIEQEMTKQLFGMYIQESMKFNQIVKQNWNSIGTDELLKRVYQEALTFGTGFLELVSNPTRDTQVIEAVHVPTQHVYLDSSVTNFQNSRYLIIAQTTTLLDIKANPYLSEYITDKVEESILASAGSYTRPYSVSSFTNDTNSSVNDSIGLYKYYKKYLKGKDVKVACFYFAGSENAPVLLYVNEDLGIENYPFAPLMFNKRTEEIYGKSFLDFLVPTQKLINKYEAIIKLRILLSARPHIFLSRSSGIDPKAFSDTRLVPGVVHLTNLDKPAEGIHVQQIDNIPSDFVNFIADAKQNLNMTAGMSEAAMGTNKVSGAGSGAVQSQLSRAMLPEQLNLLDIKTFIRQSLEILIQMIITDDQERNIIFKEPNKNGAITATSQVIYTGTDFNNLSYDLNVNVQMYTASEKQQIGQTMLQLYQMGQQFPGMGEVVTVEELVEALNLPNKQQALYRIEQTRDEATQQKVQQVIQTMMQVLQQNVQAASDQMLKETMTPEQMQGITAQPTPQVSPEELTQIITEIIQQDAVNMGRQNSSPSQGAGALADQSAQMNPQ